MTEQICLIFNFCMLCNYSKLDPDTISTLENGFLKDYLKTRFFLKTYDFTTF